MLLDVIASIRAARPDFSLGLIAGAEGPLEIAAREIGADSCALPFPASLARLGDSGAGGPAGDQTSIAALLTGISAAVPAVTGYVTALRRRITDFAPDVIHTNGFKMHILGLWASPRSVPVVWHVHDYVSRRPIMSHMMRAHAHKCAVAIAISRSVAEDVTHTCGRRLRVCRVYNAIDLAHFAPNGPRLNLDALAGMPPAPDGTARVGLVATMARWKGHENFLRAISFLRPGLPVRGYVIGGALYQTNGSQYSLEELRRMATDFGVARRVGFTGYVEDPAAAIRALDVVVHASSEPEPFGRVIAEAMACQRPVIVSEGGGAAELVTSGVDSLSYPPGAVGALTRCIRILVENPALRGQLARAGRAKAERFFDRVRLAEEIAPIYSSLANGSGALVPSRQNGLLEF
jgi:glycosyltransferase involved in cell wall biosynthesis